MCGIAGAFGPRVPLPGQVSSTLRLMRSRGPDASGYRETRLGDQFVSILHSRLSIIDLDARSNQPFEAEDCILSYNGEIYNYLELRSDLLRRGYSFHTESDTEVLIKAYRAYGDQFMDRLEGMWAFSLLDKRDGRLFLCRDRFGEKPLFYANWDGMFYFGSEVKFLARLAGRRPTPNLDQLRRYLVNGYKSLYKREETFFSDVSVVPPACCLELRTPKDFEVRKYWSIDYRPQLMSMEEAIEGTRAHLLDAIHYRLRSDVPIAFCLSGGVDSTALASIAVREFDQQIDAFSVIDSDERYDETRNISATVRLLDCRHHVTRTSTQGFLGRMRQLVGYHDSPVATISYYVHSFLSEKISSLGFKVAISGTGADEIFTGYYDHYGFWLAEMRQRSDFDQLVKDWRSSYGSFVENPFLKNPLTFINRPKERRHIYLNRSIFSGLLVEPLEEDFEEALYCNSLLRNRLLNELHHEVVPVILHEDDLNSMMWSVENRSPYLDRRLIEFLYTVPNEHLVYGGKVKWLLRAAANGYGPESVLNDQRKRGFNASIDSLLDRGDVDTADALMSDGPIFDIVSRDKMGAFMKQNMHDNSFSKFLFSFISARLFLESDIVSGEGEFKDAA